MMEILPGSSSAREPVCLTIRGIIVWKHQQIKSERSIIIKVEVENT